MSVKPVTAEELRQRLDDLDVDLSSPVAVAISGGADSMALALLLGKICEVYAVTIDHGLRPEAAEEARLVAEVMARHSIAHEIVTWQGEKPSSGIQAAAREARYRLLGRWCTEKSISTLMLAHHRDDQAETFLMRLSRGSGVYGLAAMADKSPLMGSLGRVQLIRPLLHLSKERLVATLEEWQEVWVEDPSNLDMQYDRIKAREYLKNPTLLKLDSEKLAKTADRMQRARQALDYYASELLASAVVLHDAGYCELDVKALYAAPQETGLRALARLVRHISGAAYSPRFEKLERAYSALGGDDFSGQTLFGCQLIKKSDKVIVVREPASIDEKPWSGCGLWDGRYDIQLSGQGEVKKLGEEGWLQIKAQDSNAQKNSIIHPARLSLPTLWQGNKVISQPHLGFGEGIEAQFSPICAL